MNAKIHPLVPRLCGLLATVSLIHVSTHGERAQQALEKWSDGVPEWWGMNQSSPKPPRWQHSNANQRSRTGSRISPSAHSSLASAEDQGDCGNKYEQQKRFESHLCLLQNTSMSIWLFLPEETNLGQALGRLTYRLLLMLNHAEVEPRKLPELSSVQDLIGR